MRGVWVLFFLLLVAANASAQELVVINGKTGEPVENVVLYNNSKEFFTTTDNKGKAFVKNLEAEDLVLFQHPSFITIELSFTEILSSGKVIRLTEKILNLEEVIVSANKWEQDEKEVPVRIEKITPEMLELQNPQTTADVLSSTGKVYVQKSQQGGGSPMIRGFAANRVLIVVDGVRMNNAIYRSGNLQNVLNIDANNIETAEVIFGPGSVVYGSDALGGVMDFHTLTPRLPEREELVSDSIGVKKLNSFILHGKALARYSSANNEMTTHLNLNYGVGKWAFVSSASFSDFGELRMGSRTKQEYQRDEYVRFVDGQDQVVLNQDPNLQIGSGFNQFNVLQKIRFKPNDEWDLRYDFHFSKTSDIPRYDRLTERRNGELRFAEWYYGPQQWEMHAFHVKFRKSNVAFDEMKLSTAYQYYKESRNDRRFNDLTLRSREEKVHMTSVNADFEKALGSRHQLYYGAEAVVNYVRSSGYTKEIDTLGTTPIASRYPDQSKYTTLAAYVNYKANAGEKLSFIAGARYSHILLDANLDLQFYPFPFSNINLSTGSLNGSIGMVYRPKEDWQLNINAGTGFRAPNIDDAGKIFDSEPGAVVVPNDDLVPEYLYSVDASVKGKVWSRLDLEIGAFFSYLDNALVREDFSFNGQDSILYDGEMSRVQAIQNLDNALIYGLEFAMKVKISNFLSFRSQLTWSKGEDSQNNALRHISPLFGKSHLIFERDKFLADLYLQYSGGFDFVDLAPSEQNKPQIYATDANGNPFSPAWMTLNLKMNYEINNFLTASAGVENILDRRYRTYSSGIAAPGRNLIIALRAKF